MKRNKNLDRPRSEGEIIERTCVSTGVVDSKYGDDHVRKSMQFGERKPSELWGVSQRDRNARS